MAAFAADEDDGELGVGVVLEVADVLELVAGEALCLVQDEGTRVGGERCLERSAADSAAQIGESMSVFKPPRLCAPDPGRRCRE